jgi:hypothetical protein
VDVDVEAAAAVAVVPPRIGIFLHGGGYVHMSAHESSRTSRIPRRLIKDGLFSEIYAVEYRLLQHAPFPAVLQDAAAVYVHVLARYESTGCRIVLIGDSSGGNLALALARWVRDEGAMRMPDGLLLLSVRRWFCFRMWSELSIRTARNSLRAMHVSPPSPVYISPTHIHPQHTHSPIRPPRTSLAQTPPPTTLSTPPSRARSSTARSLGSHLQLATWTAVLRGRRSRSRSRRRGGSWR